MTSCACVWMLPALVLGLFGGSNAVAQQEAKPAAPRPGTKWAVVVGVNQYLDRDIPKLSYSVPDAWLVAEQLAAKCGYEPNHVLVITDDQEKPHLRPLRINLEEQIPAWLERAEPGDTVFVFFAGHGFLDDRGQGYLAPQDCRLNRLGLTGLRTEELRNMLQNCKATQKVLVLDCCHSGSAKGDAPAGPSGQELGAAFRQAEGLVTLASCRKTEKSYEWLEREHGLFTFYIAEGLGGAADYDRDGIVDSDELYRYLSDHVPATARAELNAKQTPIRLIGDDVAGVFPLARLGGPSMTLRRKSAPAAAMPGRPQPGAAPGQTHNGIRQLTERCTVPIASDAALAAISPDGKTLAALGRNHAIVLYDAATGEEEEMLKEPGAEMSPFATLTFSPNGRLLALTEDNRGGVRLWDWKQKRLLPAPPLIPNEQSLILRASAFAGNGGLAIATTFSGNEINGAVKLWDLMTGKVRRLADGRGPAPGNWVSALASSPDGKTLAIGYQSGVVALCDPATGAIKTAQSLHTGIVKGLSFAPGPHGNLLASFEENNQAVKLWDANALQRKGSLPQKGAVWAVAFCPDGKTILTASQNAEREHLKLWDAVDRRDLGTRTLTQGPADWVNAIAFTPDGKTLMTKMYTMSNFTLAQTVTVWDYKP